MFIIREACHGLLYVPKTLNSMRKGAVFCEKDPAADVQEAERPTDITFFNEEK